MKNPESLTEKLHQRADRKLHAFINSHVQPLWDEYEKAKGRAREFFERPPETVRLQNGEVKSPWMGEYRVNFKNVYFATMQPFYRDAEVREFMARVDAVSQEFEELRMQEGGVE